MRKHDIGNICAIAKDDDGDEEIIPVDQRWQVYYIKNGELRVRTAPGLGDLAKQRTLLCRKSAKRVTCLAACDRLKREDIEAQPLRNDPHLSSVMVNFDGEPSERSSLLRKILEACIAELGV